MRWMGVWAEVGGAMCWRVGGGTHGVGGRG